MDLAPLRDEITIGANYIFLHADQMGFYPTFLCVVNYLVAEQRAQAINGLTQSIKFVPYHLRYCIDETPNAFFLNAHDRYEFSTDVREWISWQSTVTYFAMQIAYFLGASPVYLIGVDHHYTQPAGGCEGSLLIQRGPDQNHFSPEYFAPGFQWQQADTASMEVVYGLAKDAFERGGREILNATVGGRLELFPRVDHRDLF